MINASVLPSPYSLLASCSRRCIMHVNLNLHPPGPLERQLRILSAQPTNHQSLTINNFSLWSRPGAYGKAPLRPSQPLVSFSLWCCKGRSCHRKGQCIWAYLFRDCHVAAPAQSTLSLASKLWQHCTRRRGLWREAQHVHVGVPCELTHQVWATSKNGRVGHILILGGVTCVSLEDHPWSVGWERVSFHWAFLLVR